MISETGAWISIAVAFSCLNNGSKTVGGEVIRRARLKAGNLRKKLPIALKNGMQRTLRIAKNMANAKRNPMNMRGKDNSR